MTDEEHTEVPQLAPFNPTKKKKKKVVIQDITDEKTESLSVADGVESSKPVETIPLNQETGDEQDEREDSDSLREKSDHDRFYSELLDRVYENLREHNPELSGDGRRTVMRPPQVLRQGTKKTVFANFMNLDDDLVVTQILSILPFKSLMRFKSVCKPWKSTIEQDSYFIKLHRAHSQRLLRFLPIIACKKGTKKTVISNFMDVCKSMHREPGHLIMFLLYELGTSGSLDSQHRLVVKGRFMPKHFEGILQRFINEYVICIRCKSPDTILTKKTCLFDLRCEECGFYRAVPQLLRGFICPRGPRNAGT